MKNIAFIIYRKWAFNIFEKILNNYQNKNINFILISIRESEVKLSKYNNINKYIINPRDDNELLNILSKHKIKIALFYGWSWIVSKKIYSNFLSLCLHPSDLPKYRGGSPLQHQIINGVNRSAVTVFKISKKIDYGHIYKKIPISLKGELIDIFRRITLAGVKITLKLIKDLNEEKEFFFYRQKKNNFIYKRRKKSESEFTLNFIKNKNFFYVNNFIRALNDPYPNAFFKLRNKLIFITKIKKNRKNKNIVTIDSLNTIPRNIKGHYIRIKDCFIEILKGHSSF